MSCSLKELLSKLLTIETEISGGCITPDHVKEYLMAYNSINKGLEAGNKLIEAVYSRNRSLR